MLVGSPALQPEKSVSEEIALLWDGRQGLNAGLTLGLMSLDTTELYGRKVWLATREGSYSGVDKKTSAATLSARYNREVQFNASVTVSGMPTIR